VLATESQDGRARLWDVDNGRELRATQPREGYVESVAFHPDGKLLAYGLRGGSAWLWDTVSGSELMIAATTTSNVSFSADGRWLAFSARDGSIHLWDAIARRDGPVLLYPLD